MTTTTNPEKPVDDSLWHRSAVVTTENGYSLRRAIAGLTDGFVLHDDGGTILEVNEQSSFVLGFKPERLRHRNLMEFVVPEAMIRLAHYLEADNGEPVLLLARHSDGRTIPLQLRAVGFVTYCGRRVSIATLKESHA